MIKIFLLLIIAQTFGLAQTEGILNRLLAPGPLIEGHKDLEGSQCLKCHEAGKGISQSKCLECHKEIRIQTASKKGFHGLTQQSCVACHSDHKGRDNDTTLVDQGKFDHNLTGYKLEGKHSELACVKCHTGRRTQMLVRKNGIRFTGAQTSCTECHRKEDPHKFAGKWKKFDCIQCHGLKSWKADLKFDHLRDAHFKLEGSHAEMKCAECHKNGKYEWKSLKKDQCLSCHSDFHKQNLGPKYRNGKCETCHSQETWKIADFNHKVTGYALRGKHSELKCNECHKQSPKTNPAQIKNYHFSGLKADCLSCHKDFHKFSNSKSKKFGTLNNCLACHTEKAWSPTPAFNHSVHTRFSIEGKHIGLECAQCHLEGPKRKPLPKGKYHWDELSTKTCEACHTSPHRNDPSPTFKKKRCDQCHIADGWTVFNRNGKKFDHDKTRFKLTGRHMQINCSACHVDGKKQVFKFEHADQQFCIDCHKNQHVDQFHETFSQKTCNECHNTSKFSEIKEFNHGTTAFPLKGKHENLNCKECHKSTDSFFETQPPHAKSQFLFPDLKSKDCMQCHSDFHKGQLGNKCSACHEESDWKKIRFDHNKQSRFLIRGKHTEVKCEECHKTQPGQFVVFKGQKRQVTTFKPLNAECITCHKDPHKGHYGQQCHECHMDKGWKLTKDFHRGFSLSGVHFSLQCQECHRDNRQLTGMSQDCVLCHQKDDIHQGTLPNCSECHKQQFWENVDFKHSLSQFPLRGAHRSLECAQCHSRGVYQGTPSQCINCHLANAQTSPVHPNPIPNFTNCQNCHNQFVW